MPKPYHSSVLGALTLAAFVLGAASARAETGDAAAGRKRAVQCAVCHGLDGKAKIPEAANLAGQNEQYFIIALSAYKSGARKNEMMSLVAPALSDQDIADLAAYYSSIGTAVPPPK